MQTEPRFAYASLRPGQRELAVKVYESCISGRILVAEAMSGFGKTAAVLAGVIAAAEETDSKVVYACRTKRQILRVTDELATLQGKYPVTSASMLTKFDYCLLMRRGNRMIPPESFGWYCSFNVQNNLCSYFLNVPLVFDEFDKLVKKTMAHTPTHQRLMAESEEIHVCPYEVARLALVQARVSVVPYPYVFDRRSASVLFDRNLIERSKTILVVDEAHNLRDYIRGVNSSSISIDQLESSIREAELLMMDEPATSLRAFKSIIEEALESRPGWLLSRGALVGRISSEKGVSWLQNLANELTNCSNAAWGSVALERRLPAVLLRVGGFVSMLSSEDGMLLVKLNRALGLLRPNPVESLGDYLREFKGVTLISATVNPSEIFTRSLGLGVDDVSTFTVSSISPMDIKTVIDTGVTTTYRLRTPRMFSKIADRIVAVLSTTPGGVGVFTPSYLILDELQRLVSERVDGRNIVAEARGLTSQEAADAFDSFCGIRESVLFAVQGGRFSEGEDFKGELMDTVIVVGLSLPPPSPMLYAEYACLKRSGETEAFMMLSRLPALRKAFQAAGRHIRNPGKRGMVVMLDHRFGSAIVRDLMPPWLKKDVITGDFSPEGLAAAVTDFWGQKD